MIISFIHLVSIILEFLISISLYRKISISKKSKIITSVVFIFAFSIQCINNFYFLGKSQLVMLVSIFSLFILSFIYNIQLISRIWASLLLFIIGVLSEFTIAFLSTTIFDVDTSYTQSDPILLALCTIAAKFLSYIITHMLKFNKNAKNIFPFNISFSFLPLPLATLLIVILLYSCCYEIEQNIFRIIALISSLLLIGANFFMLELIAKNNEHSITKAQLTFSKKQILQQAHHYEELYRWQNDFKKFRHDIKNQQLCILGLIQSGENEKAIITIKKGLDIINEPEKLLNSGNPVLDSIIYSKLETAKNQKIQITSNIKLNESINIDSVELGIIIGNALDNAIEAAMQIPDNSNINKCIHIQVLSIAGSISIEVTNSVQYNIETQNLISTKNDNEFHGMGIKIMRALIEKYNGDLYFSCKNNLFKTNIIISNVPL